MKCFVIMPFGVKELDGVSIDFDEVYKKIISPAVRACKLKPVRCDKIDGAGLVHRDMFESIQNCDIAIADISMANPNVFYELGVRHALKRSVTVIMRHEETSLPFNVGHLKAITYGLDDKARKRAKDEIAAYIRDGIGDWRNDSPIFNVLRHRVERKFDPIRKKKVETFNIPNAPGKTVELVGGVLENFDDVDVWVNSENTNMEMARRYDRSVSAKIRFLGAEINEFGEITDDVVCDALRAQMGPRGCVEEGVVLATPPGRLARTHNVKHILHVATVRGDVEKGYVPLGNPGFCVYETLLAAAALSPDDPPRSIVFPFFGTGHGKDRPEDVAPKLIGAATSYFANHPDSSIDRVAFVALTQTIFNVCKGILENREDIVLSPVETSVAPSSVVSQST